jgi:dTDP-4-dehydrorhamnose reductase
MVGGGDRDHKFVAKILNQLRNGARTVYAVGDKWGTPTYAPDFAECLANLIETESYGLYHMACLGNGTRLDVARKILQVLGLDREVELIEVDSAYFKNEFPAPRPRSEMMRNLLLDLQGLNTMRHWEDSLEEYLLSAFAELPIEAGGSVLERRDLVTAQPIEAMARPLTVASSNGLGTHR